MSRLLTSRLVGVILCWMQVGMILMTWDAMGFPYGRLHVREGLVTTAVVTLCLAANLAGRARRSGHSDAWGLSALGGPIGLIVVFALGDRRAGARGFDVMT